MPSQIREHTSIKQTICAVKIKVIIEKLLQMMMSLLRTMRKSLKIRVLGIPLVKELILVMIISAAVFF